MKNSFLLKILALVTAAVLLFVLLTSILYFFISRNIYSDMKAEELHPKALTISEFVNMYNKGEISFAYFSLLIRAGPSAWDAWVFVVDGDGRMIVQTNIPESVDPDGSFLRGISSQTDTVLEGNEVRFSGKLKNDNFGMMIVGVPVKDGQNVTGAVFLAKPLYEITAGVNILNRALFISALICLIVMILPTAYAVKKILKPLKDTRDVAIAMANGDFTVRAKLIPKGEIGDLALSFNLLADKLEKTISDLVFEKNRLMRIINGLAEGIIAVDARCEVTHANPALWKLIHEKKMGRTFNYPQKKDMRSVAMRPNNPQFIRNQLISDESVWDDFKNVIHTSVPVTREITHNENIIRVMITPIEDENRNTIGAVGLFHDITEAKLLEQTRKDYIANISHELKTPLTAMRGLIEPLSEDMVKDKETRTKYYGIILRETMRLSRLIDDMLELSRLQSKKIKIETKPFSIDTVVKNVIQKFSPKADEKNISLEASEKFKTAPLLMGNPDRVEQILTILVDNAFKFTPYGKEISIDLNFDKNTPSRKAFISVKDTGVGIEPEKLKNVFERFFKSDSSRSETEGTGLGLSIAKEILNVMNEDITVESEPGKGSVFTFSLPVKK